MCYWDNIIFIRTRSYQYNINLLKLRKIRSKTKFYKKVVKKTKTNYIFKIFKLSITLTNFTLAPPLSTFLNLIGVNAQNFIEHLNKTLLNFLSLNTYIILTIFLRKDLSFNVNVNINYNTIIKSLYFTNFFNLSLLPLQLLSFLNVFKRRFLNYSKILPIENEIFSNRFYTNLDFLLITFFIYFLQSYIFSFNTQNNNLHTIIGLSSILEFESLLNIIYGSVKSHHINFLHTRDLLQKSKILLRL